MTAWLDVKKSFCTSLLPFDKCLLLFIFPTFKLAFNRMEELVYFVVDYAGADPFWFSYGKVIGFRGRSFEGNYGPIIRSCVPVVVR